MNIIASRLNVISNPNFDTTMTSSKVEGVIQFVGDCVMQTAMRHELDLLK